MWQPANKGVATSQSHDEQDHDDEEDHDEDEDHDDDEDARLQAIYKTEEALVSIVRGGVEA